MVSVVPTFEKMFDDFEIALPTATRLVIQISHQLTIWGALFSPLILFVQFALVCGALYYIGWLRWEPWPVSLLTRQFHRATLLLAFARATEANRPLTRTLELLALWYPRPGVLRRLEKARIAVDQGQP